MIVRTLALILKQIDTRKSIVSEKVVYGQNVALMLNCWNKAGDNIKNIK